MDALKLRANGSSLKPWITEDPTSSLPPTAPQLHGPLGYRTNDSPHRIS
jgi:hypothetical protein